MGQADDEPRKAHLLLGCRAGDLGGLALALQPLAYPIHETTTGEDFSRALAREEPACALLDPGLPGLEALEPLGGLPGAGRVPLLLLAAAESVELRLLRAYSQGRVDYLLAPFEPEALRAKVRSLVEAHRAARAADYWQLDALFNAAPDHVFVMEPDGRCAYANLAAAGVIGAAPADILGRDSRQLGFPEELARLLEGQRQRVMSGETVRAETTTALTNTSRVVEYILSPIRAEDGRVTGITGIARDVNDRKRAQEALRESEERFRAVISALAEGIVLQNAQGVLWLVNSSAESLLGLTAQQLSGRSSMDPRWRAVHEDGSPYPGQDHPAMVALRTGQPQMRQVMGVHHPDDSLVWLSINAQPLFESDGRTLSGVVASFFDITERKRDEEVRDRLLRELRDAVTARDEFLSVASHELKTPLTPLLMKLQGIRREAERSGAAHLPRAQVLRALEGAEAQIRKLTGLVNDLLDVSRISQGRLSLKLEDVDLVEVVQDAVTELRPQARKSGCEVALAAPRTLRGTWDALRLGQVITNLLTNAIKYGASRPIHVTVEPGDGRARLMVRDQGIGIAPEHVHRIFGKFERAVSERHYGGMGLGLFIAHRIVQALGGELRVESRPGEGSTFTVELPLLPPAEEALRSEPAA